MLVYTCGIVGTTSVKGLRRQRGPSSLGLCALSCELCSPFVGGEHSGGKAGGRLCCRGHYMLSRTIVSNLACTSLMMSSWSGAPSVRQKYAAVRFGVNLHVAGVEAAWADFRARAHLLLMFGEFYFSEVPRTSPFLYPVSTASRIRSTCFPFPLSSPRPCIFFASGLL